MTLAQACPTRQPQCTAGDHSHTSGEEERDSWNRVAQRATQCTRNRDRRCDAEDGDSRTNREACAAMQRTEAQAMTGAEDVRGVLELDDFLEEVGVGYEVEVEVGEDLV